jgi:hypothetical protein
MNIIIRIIYRGYASKIMRRGEFKVSMKQFKEDPDRVAANEAMKFLKMIRKEGHIEEIIEVVYNDDHDITALIKDLDNALLG